MSVNTADKSAGLPILILKVGIDAATNEELHYTDSIIAACQVQRSSETIVHNVWLNAGSLNQEHHELCVA